MHRPCQKRKKRLKKQRRPLTLASLGYRSAEELKQEFARLHLFSEFWRAFWFVIKNAEKD